MGTIVVLDNIRSSHNVGAIFRTADGAGVEEVVLVGYTPAPTDRFGREDEKLKKTSLGASAFVPWRSVEEGEGALALIKGFQHDGYTVVAVEQSAGSVMLGDWHPPEQVLYIFGNEIGGVSKELLAVADTVLELPMAGQKESLNVSVTAGIVLYRL